MRPLLLLAAAALLATCASAPTGPATDRELLAADVRDALAVAATIPEAEPYVGAVEALLEAFVEDENAFDWTAAFSAVRGHEDGFREALLSAGWDPMRVETVVTVSRMALRRIEAQVAAQPPPTASASVAIPRLVAAPIEDLPPFSPPREVRTVYQGGGWHFQNGERRDNCGDFTVGITLIGDRRSYVLMARMGTWPPAGSFWWSPYDKDPYDGWRQGSTGWGEVWEPPLKSLPKPPGTANIDTHCWVQNPLTQVITWVHGVREPSGIYHLERATSRTVDPRPEAYTRFPDVLVEGPAEECSIVIDPWLGKAFLFYVRKTNEAPDRYGIRFRSRVWRREVSLSGFDTDPRVGPEEMVFSPEQWAQPPDSRGRGPWGSAFTVLQPGICILPDKSYLMAALGKEPVVLKNGQTAVGQMNATTAVGLWRSWDQGRTWEPADGNPVFSREFLGLVRDFGNQINSPHPWFDPWQRKLYVAMQLARDGEVNRVGSRIVMCESTRRL